MSTPSPALPSITLVSAVDLGEANAPTVHQLSVASALARIGYRVTVLVPRPSGGEPAMTPHPDVRLRFAPTLRNVRVINAVGYLFVLPTLFRLARSGDAEVVYVRAGSLSLAVTLLARALRCRQAMQEHNGWLADELGMLGKPAVLSSIAKRLQVWDARLAHAVRVVDDRIGARLVEHGVAAARVFTAGNGADLSLVHPVDRATAIAKTNLLQDRRYVGYLGTLSPWQGVDQAVRALARLAERHPDVDLLIAGDGPERSRLEALADELGLTDRVRFMGQIPVQALSAVLGCFDVAVSPKAAAYARLGMSPLKLRDYAAAGRPVLVPDDEAVRRFAAHGWAELHEPDSPADLATKLAALLADDERRASMGKAARSYAEEHFGWDRTAAIIAAHLLPARAGDGAPER